MHYHTKHILFLLITLLGNPVATASEQDEQSIEWAHQLLEDQVFFETDHRHHFAKLASNIQNVGETLEEDRYTIDSWQASQAFYKFTNTDKTFDPEAYRQGQYDDVPLYLSNENKEAGHTFALVSLSPGGEASAIAGKDNLAQSLPQLFERWYGKNHHDHNPTLGDLRFLERAIQIAGIYVKTGGYTNLLPIYLHQCFQEGNPIPHHIWQGFLDDPNEGIRSSTFVKLIITTASKQDTFGGRWLSREFLHFILNLRKENLEILEETLQEIEEMCLAMISSKRPNPLLFPWWICRYIFPTAELHSLYQSLENIRIWRLDILPDLQEDQNYPQAYRQEQLCKYAKTLHEHAPEKPRTALEEIQEAAEKIDNEVQEHMQGWVEPSRCQWYAKLSASFPNQGRRALPSPPIKVMSEDDKQEICHKIIDETMRPCYSQENIQSQEAYCCDTTCPACTSEGLYGYMQNILPNKEDCQTFLTHLQHAWDSSTPKQKEGVIRGVDHLTQEAQRPDARGYGMRLQLRIFILYNSCLMEKIFSFGVEEKRRERDEYWKDLHSYQKPFAYLGFLSGYEARKEAHQRFCYWKGHATQQQKGLLADSYDQLHATQLARRDAQWHSQYQVSQAPSSTELLTTPLLLLHKDTCPGVSQAIQDFCTQETAPPFIMGAPRYQTFSLWILVPFSLFFLLRSLLYQLHDENIYDDDDDL